MLKCAVQLSSDPLLSIVKIVEIPPLYADVFTGIRTCNVQAMMPLRRKSQPTYLSIENACGWYLISVNNSYGYRGDTTLS